MDPCLSNLLSFLGCALNGVLSFLDDHQWVADPLATIVTGFLAAWVIVWQVGRQARSAIELQRESNQQSLKVEIYRTFVDSVLENAINSSTKAASDAKMLTPTMRNALSMFRNGTVPYKIYHSSNLYFDNDKAVRDTSGAILNLLEGYLIVNPRFDVFSHNIKSMLKEILTEFLKIYLEISRFMSTNSIPTDNDIDNLETTIMPYVGALDTYSSYIKNLRVVLQNEMLGELFSNRVPTRKPPAELAELRQPWWRRWWG